MTSSLKNFKPLYLNVFENDQGFIDSLSFLVGGSERERLFGVLKSWEKPFARWSELSSEASRPEKLPRIEKYDRAGNRIEQIILPMETRTIRREVVEHGIWDSKTETEKFSKVYLLAKMGEAGVTCPLACTDGLIRVIEALGSDFLKKEYLPKLKSTEYPLSGAQFITEQAGGSDVGAIEGRAEGGQDGTWKIFAEKWFCSATDEFFLVAAKPNGAPLGTEGIAIFFVPRLLEGKPNSLSIKRLKNKLGTQSLPTAEIDFEGSKGWLLGKKEEGFHNLMNYILNVSRIHNAACSLALLRRAFAEARNYAGQRVAFGKTLIEFPLIQELLLNLLSQLNSRRHFFFTMLARIDAQGFLPEDKSERLWTRFLINLMKYRSAFQLSENIKEAITVMGANGIVEDFSIMPRLLRDSLIVETWEGPHNVLCLQILRDAGRFDFLGRLRKEIGKIAGLWQNEDLPRSRKLFEEACSKLWGILTPQNLKDPVWVQRHARRVVDRVANILEIGTLAVAGSVHRQKRFSLMASHLAHRTFLGRDSGFDNPVLTLPSSVCLDLIWEREIPYSPDKF